MISLRLQLLALVFSIVYGVIVSFLFNLNYKLLFHSKRVVKIICDVIFVFDLGFIYFFFLEKFVDGYINFYFFVLVLFSFLCFFTLFKKILRKDYVNK